MKHTPYGSVTQYMYMSGWVVATRTFPTKIHDYKIHDDSNNNDFVAVSTYSVACDNECLTQVLGHSLLIGFKCTNVQRRRRSTQSSYNPEGIKDKLTPLETFDEFRGTNNKRDLWRGPRGTVKLVRGYHICDVGNIQLLSCYKVIIRTT
jgi:hypothetical protein